MSCAAATVAQAAIMTTTNIFLTIHLKERNDPSGVDAELPDNASKTSPKGYGFALSARVAALIAASLGRSERAESNWSLHALKALR
jgi:hypothetical protein